MPTAPLTIRIATRASALAMYQSRRVAAELEALGKRLNTPVATVLCRIKTTGDIQRDKPLAAMEAAGKGLFTREIDRALADNAADIAVHSMKDLPGERPPHLMLGAVLERAQPWDAVAFREPGWTVATLPRGAKVAVGSERRRLQLERLRPDLQFSDLRGNIPTRIKKLSAGADAVVVAAAALQRLEISPIGLQILTREQMLPAIGQGIIAVECRRDFSGLFLLEALRHPATWLAARAERAFLTAFGGGCHMPVGGMAWQEAVGGLPAMTVAYFSRQDGRVVADEASGRGVTGDEPELLGREMARRLKELTAAQGVR